MFRAFEYFQKIAPECGISQVYRVTGLSRLEELIRNVRQTRYPCLAVEIGTDGLLNILSGRTNETYHTFYVLDSVGDRPEDMERIAQILDSTFRTGETLLRRMKVDSGDISAPCYGLNASRITYSPCGPVGMLCYGYAFNFTMTRDHE